MDTDHIIGVSGIFRQKIQIISRLAHTDKDLLILGETGTGKGLVAKKIHSLSFRRKNPFIEINCANLSPSLFESELLGFVRGSFTGAERNKTGLIESADSGTVLFDEVGKLSLELQAKLLKLVEDKIIRRVGGTDEKKIDVRFIFATNESLYKETEIGNFRKDLFYRINALQLFLPPLRERKQDIPHLANHFLRLYGISGGGKKYLSHEAVNTLMEYDYPGNIRELKNLMERAIFFCESQVIKPQDIQIENRHSYDSGITPQELRHLIMVCEGNKTKAAMCLGKSRRQLYRILDRYEMHDLVSRRDEKS